MVTFALATVRSYAMGTLEAPDRNAPSTTRAASYRSTLLVQLNQEAAGWAVSMGLKQDDAIAANYAQAHVADWPIDKLVNFANDALYVRDEQTAAIMRIHLTTAAITVAVAVVGWAGANALTKGSPIATVASSFGLVFVVILAVAVPVAFITTERYSDCKRAWESARQAAFAEIARRSRKEDHP